MMPSLPLAFACLLALLPCALSAEESNISLAGEWRFQLDAKNTGVQEKWYAKKLEDRVKLPGTTDENHKGIQQDEKPTDRLARLWFWKGPAWYQRDVTIPASWTDKRITLFLERTKNSRVWVDETLCGREDSLSAPHVFDLTKAMTPGRHTITVLIDNSKLPPVGPAHAVDERTQTNWNGIVGKMELRATDPVWIDDVQVYPDLANKKARVKLTIGNITGKSAEGKITVSSESYNTRNPVKFENQGGYAVLEKEKTVVNIDCPLGPNAPLWNEFDPTLIRLTLLLESTTGDKRFSHTHVTRFGMRSFTREGSQLLVNGKPVFLRGRLDCANYPLTGYAPMGLDDWRRIFKITNAWGINHYRFHTWCPPAAAIEAADELGVYLQLELPNKRSAFKAPDNKEAAVHNIDFLEVKDIDPNASLYEYGKREGELIFRYFGNSPSFVMFMLGNELGRNQGMFDLVAHFKKIEPRILHAQGANNNHWDASLAEGDDFWVTSRVSPEKLIRGSFSLADSRNPHIEYRPPSTMVDYRKSIEDVPVPVISHEIGAFQVSPDFRDIPQFTGVLQARNYEIFRQRLEKAGMLDQAHDFVRASGALAAICYREDIEAALRTPGFGGFQLLDIMDFPGQGTAPVGMLNVLMESKGIIEPKEWREFCSEIVPLFRMEKYTWTTDEIFRGEIQIAHFEPKDLSKEVVTVTLSDDSGKTIGSTQGRSAASLEKAGLHSIGRYELPLNTSGIKVPQKLTLTLAIAGTPYRNRYPLWVYPPKADTTVPKGVMVASSFNAAETRAHLAAGGKVLLIPPHSKLPLSVQGGFQTDYWSPMFAESARKRGEPEPPGTLGILCDPAHPALSAFPTEFHSNWQWWHLVKNSRPIAYDGSPNDYRPIVQVIDNFARNHKLGLIAETKVGKGSMLICAIDLLGHQDKPEARQMLHSLLRYIDSPDFAPKTELDADLLNALLPECR